MEKTYCEKSILCVYGQTGWLAKRENLGKYWYNDGNTHALSSFYFCCCSVVGVEQQFFLLSFDSDECW